MTVAERPLIEHAAFWEALAVHGALLPFEVKALGLSDDELLAHPDLVKRVETQIGPLYLPGVHRHSRDDIGRPITSRTVHAASDGAYVRLFMRRNQGMQGMNWLVPRYDLLGILRSNLDEMARFVIPSGDMVVCGKWQGGGMSTRTLKRYLVVHSDTLRRRRWKLLIIAPFITRYEYLGGLYQDVLALSEYTLEDAYADNQPH